MYTIGELSNLLGVSREMVRKYERAGLLIPCRGVESSHRYYDEQALDTAILIKMYRHMGLSLQEIATLLRGGGSDQAMRMLSERIDAHQAEITLLERRIAALRHAQEDLLTAGRLLGKREFCLSPEVWVLHMPDIDAPRRAQTFSYLKELTDFMPVANFAHVSIRFDLGRLPQGGLCFLADDVRSCGIRLREDLLVRIPSAPALRGVLAIQYMDEDEERDNILSVHEQINAEVLKSGYRQQGTMIGRSLMTWYENGRKRGYVEAWFLLERAD